MDDSPTAAVPDSLRYDDGQYVPERGWLGDNQTLRSRRIAARFLRAVHKPWFVVRIPVNVGALTTTGRKSGKPRSTYVKAVRSGNKAYLVSIPGQHALWLKNIRANPTVTLRLRGGTYTGVVRDPADEAERTAARAEFCDAVHPFDYAENIFHRRGRPTRAKIVELHHAWFEGGTPLVVELGARVRRNWRGL
ncbi:nitroreductase family deazaflavin-dependent oxidoreductase [Antrihabitans sp. YC2-6]|uniref:nitroreductase family deazaflavin-dependent oxidoreductase n=1 Tax=Antrihabitans sp. YC2-6 TaxID=2799498 RepID=UPI0018F54C83|nr:nitroreductase family deazaflavin-dependent oxidoreductase [Antrihabitans sp. YC2-6]MBJ8347558.1 nitroreductase family deazaflavin-dependent oxidoreductase [Antrihabitans sp. YC2-6]